MGHYEGFYEDIAEEARKERRNFLLPIAEKLDNLKRELLRAGYSEDTKVYEKLQEALFWLKNDIPADV